MRTFVAIVVVLASATGHAAPCADADACVEEGKRLEAKDPRAAFAAFDRGCQMHYPLSCVGAAFLLRDGKLGKPDRERAQGYLVIACGKNFEEPLSCALVGTNLLKDIGGTGDHAKNVELATVVLRKSCEGGAPLGCYNLGVVARDGMGMKPDPKLAYASFEKACAGGEAKGCAEQANGLHRGLGVAKDEPRALALFEKACNDEPAACFNLAYALSQGIAGKKDDVRARALYVKACDAGEAVACYNLAMMIAGARGGPANSAEAHRRLDQACKLGARRACN
jgi:uncharacterized protein